MFAHLSLHAQWGRAQSHPCVSRPQFSLKVPAFGLIWHGFTAIARWYYTANSGLQSQSVFYTQKTLESPATVLLDPNTFSTDGTVALNDVSFSWDGSLAAYSISRALKDLLLRIVAKPGIFSAFTCNRIDFYVASRALLPAA